MKEDWLYLLLVPGDCNSVRRPTASFHAYTGMTLFSAQEEVSEQTQQHSLLFHFAAAGREQQNGFLNAAKVRWRAM